MAELRSFPFVWVTWLVGLLSGDKQCRYALWFKAQHQYRKRFESDETQARLGKWRLDHDDAVRARVDTLKFVGHRVTVEDQNKFFVRGKTATLSGKADIVLITKDGVGVVEDVKTGKRKESDFWQVVVYLIYLPKAVAALKGIALRGSIRYRDGTREVAASEANAENEARVTKLMHVAAAPTAPDPVPSPRECGDCDVDECQYRVDAEVATGTTDTF